MRKIRILVLPSCAAAIFVHRTSRSGQRRHDYPLSSSRAQLHRLMLGSAHPQDRAECGSQGIGNGAPEQSASILPGHIRSFWWTLFRLVQRLPLLHLHEPCCLEATSEVVVTATATEHSPWNAVSYYP